MRTYGVAVASLAINAPIKWTDNLLSQYEIAGVITTQRGVARRIPHAALLLLAIARELHETLRLSVRDAVAMAPALLDDGAGAAHSGGHLRVVLDRPALERDIAARLRDALESAPSPRRGRPPKRGATPR